MGISFFRAISSAARNEISSMILGCFLFLSLLLLEGFLLPCCKHPHAPCPISQATYGCMHLTAHADGRTPHFAWWSGIQMQINACAVKQALLLQHALLVDTQHCVCR